MTTQVERLVEENMKLAPYIYHQHFRSSIKDIQDEEDLIATGYIGLVKAAKTYKSSKGAFSTYACACIHREITSLLLTNDRKKRKSAAGTVYLDQLDHTDRIVADQEDFTEQIEARFIAKEALSILEDKYRVIVEMYFGLNGYRPHVYTEISAKYGVTQQRIGYIIRNSIKQMKHHLIQKEAS